MGLLVKYRCVVGKVYMKLKQNLLKDSKGITCVISLSLLVALKVN